MHIIAKIAIAGRMKKYNLKDQFGHHFVAILSLCIAVIALGYTTWREEVTEKNRNNRVAAFEVLKNLGELQVIVNYVIYEPENPMANIFLGWGHVAIISDLGSLLPDPIPNETKHLVEVWASNAQNLQHDEKAQDAVTKEIDSSRQSLLRCIQSLR